MFGVAGWIVLGLIVGAIAKLLMRPAVIVLPRAGSVGLTMAIGCAGALVAGYGGYALGLYGIGDPAGLVFAVFGAALFLVVYRVYPRIRAMV
jgi:uncharacterized membrane protein YeaQ/YmgE (transglycosylase-associated protein family)